MTETPMIDADHEAILNLADETRFDPNGIVRRTLFRTPAARLVVFGLDAGQELAEHASAQHALVQVLSGECEFTFGGAPRTLKTGDLLHMPANLSHSVKAHQRCSLLLTSVKPESTPLNTANPVAARVASRPPCTV